MQKIILIPAYQPDERLVTLTEALQSRDVRIFIVNDGSDASCAPVFQACAQHATILTHDVNRGKGAALKTGLACIRQTCQPPYAVVTADADGQHAPADVLRLLDAAAEQPEALILGSRKVGRDMPLRSRLGNAITRGVFRIVAGTRVSDTQTGLRACTDRAVSALLAVSGERYEYEMNVLLEWVRSGRTVRELAIETIYLDGNASSHFDAVRDSARIYREILRFSGAGLVSFAADYLLFSLLYLLTGALAVANIAARCLCAGLNYTLNRRAVFRSHASVAASLAKYALLAAGILVVNTLLLQALTALGLPALAAKLFVEATLFFVSYAVQRRFVFRVQDRQNPSGDTQEEVRAA